MCGSAERRRVAVAADGGRRGGSRGRWRQCGVERSVWGESAGVVCREGVNEDHGEVELGPARRDAESGRDERNHVVVSSQRERNDANRTDRTGRCGRNGTNRSAGGEVAKGIYEKQPVGLCDTYVRSCPLAVASPILYQMGSRAGRRRESLESIAEARIDNVSFETKVSDVEFGNGRGEMKRNRAGFANFKHILQSITMERIVREKRFGKQMIYANSSKELCQYNIVASKEMR